MAMSPYVVFRRPIVTEKTTMLRTQYAEREKGEPLVKYTFEVDVNATKTDIKAAMESLFPESKGNIVKINTMHVHGKAKDPDKGRRSRRFRPGKTADRKKAIVTLRDGVTIPQFEGF